MPHRKPHRATLAMLLAGLSTLGPFSIDTYMPSFPAIQQSLNATPLQVQQTLSVYLLCFAVMMLFHGSFSDSFGRRPIILGSLVAFVLTSIACVFANDINTLIVLRGMQGLSAGAGLIVGRAIIRDLYAGAEAQRLMSQITMMFAISPAIAPIIGGWLHLMFGWHSVFVFMAVLGLLLLVLSWRYLPETHPLAGRHPFSMRPLIGNYHQVARHPHFLLLAGTVALHFAGFFLYIASAPVFVLRTLHLREDQFAWLFIPAITGVMIGAFLSGRLAGRITQQQTVKYAYVLLLSAAAINLAYNSTFIPAWPWAILPIALYGMGMSLAMPSITLLALDLFPQHRGLVSSMQGFVQTMLNAIVAGIISPMLSFSPMYLALGMMGFLLLGRVTWQIYCRVESSG
ncbi:Bcr/CflA family drug resistance efflux transporter [Sulfuriferula sp. AH1]|uniref:multidrug effflux MFS transporter n=1 Tax=Sulfuriferula sp. AH1 TaxID=1985873 RepID=UPI000B3B2FF2|nr:multidrug effflux MFS transporter [Sulfuriferula sp. AH1]ARU30926.1 Bcr/CflA family drug resistance efflux transporter [Sulfuriferula sp. AH1]